MPKKPKEQEMGQKRYEISDEQWEQIKDMIQHSKMGRSPKDDRLMLNAIFWIARSGSDGSVPTKQYTAVSANGGMMVRCIEFSAS
jgi:hypothetical protein